MARPTTSDRTACEDAWSSPQDKDTVRAARRRFSSVVDIVPTWPTNGEDQDQTSIQAPQSSAVWRNVTGSLVLLEMSTGRRRRHADDCVFAPRPCHVPCQGRRGHNEDLCKTGELLERFVKTGHPVRAKWSRCTTSLLLQAFCHFSSHSLFSEGYFPHSGQTKRANYIAVTLSFLPRSRRSWPKSAILPHCITCD